MKKHFFFKKILFVKKRAHETFNYDSQSFFDTKKKKTKTAFNRNESKRESGCLHVVRVIMQSSPSDKE